MSMGGAYDGVGGGLLQSLVGLVQEIERVEHQLGLVLGLGCLDLGLGLIEEALGFLGLLTLRVRCVRHQCHAEEEEAQGDEDA